MAPRPSPSAGSVSALARALSVPLGALRRLGFPPVARLSPGELRGRAHGLSYGLCATVWQALRRAPSWDEVSRAWEDAVARTDGVDPGLHGRFDGADTVALLGDNREAFAARARLYARARRRIDLATYYIQADEVGRATLRDLAAAVARGVRVRFVADAQVMRQKEQAGLGALGLVDALRAAGVEVRLWEDPARPYDVSHRKLLVVDGEAVLLGGRNLAEHYAGEAWRDVEILVEGPTAREAEALFERTFAGQPEPRGAGGVLHATAPADVRGHAGFVYLLQCLRAARRTVDLENAYYLRHPALERSLVAARRRGLRVRLLTNSAESNDLDFANYRLYAGFRGLLEAGVEVWLRRGAGRTLHGKYFVVDGAWVGLGSTNLDYYSPRYCTDLAAHVSSPALGAALGAWFERGLAEADRLTDPARIEAVLRRERVARGFDAVLRDLQ